MGENQEMETEVKVRVESLEHWRNRLERFGFVLFKAQADEVSVLFDRQGELCLAESALRLRNYHGLCTLTFKGPKVKDPLLKIRPELETEVADQRQMEGILAALGYAPVFKMVKSRSMMVWASPAGEKVVACLDEAPFGCYLELEGSRAVLEDLMVQLQIPHTDVETRSYPRLFKEHGWG